MAAQIAACPGAQSEAARDACGHQLHEACANVGFFYVRGTGIPDATSQDVLDAARRWFSLPDAVKQQLAIGPQTHYRCVWSVALAQQRAVRPSACGMRRGYQRLGSNVTRFDGSFQRDWHEALDLYHEVGPAQARRGLCWERD